MLWAGLTRLMGARTHSAREELVRRFLGQAGYMPNSALEHSVLEWLEAGTRQAQSLRVGGLRGVTAISLPSGRHSTRGYRSRYRLLDTFDPGRDIQVIEGRGLSFSDSATPLKQQVERYLTSRMS